MTRASASRRPEVLVAPTITFISVLALLLIARVYDELPVKASDCRFKSVFGIPCVSCGGTRSMQSLAQGDLTQAITFNPAVVVGVIAVCLWFISGCLRFRRGDAPLSVPQQNRRIRNVSLTIAGLLVLNWVYLLFFLK